MTYSKNPDDILKEMECYPKVSDSSDLKTKLSTSRGNVYHEVPKIMLPKYIHYLNGLDKNLEGLQKQLKNKKSVNERKHLQKEINDLEKKIEEETNRLYSEKVNWCFKHVNKMY